MLDKGNFRVNYTFEALANSANVPADIRSAPINSSLSLIKSVAVKSGKTVYEARDIHKAIFIKNLLDYSDDYSRSVAKSQFWYLDSDDTNVTADAATNSGIRQRGLLSHGGVLRSEPSFPSTAIHSSKNYLINVCHRCNLTWDCASGWRWNDLSKRRHRAAECCPKVWIKGSETAAIIWRTKVGHWKFHETDSVELLVRNGLPQLQP